MNENAIQPEEYQERVSRLQKLAKARDYAAVIAYSAHRDYMPGDCMYLANWYTIEEASAIVVVPVDDSPTLLIDVDWDIDRANDEAMLENKRVSHDYAEAIQRILKKAGRTKAKVAISGWHIFPARLYLALREKLPGVEFVDDPSLMYELRMYKSPAELNLMRAAARSTDIAIETMHKFSRAGVTEYEVAAEGNYALEKLGAVPSFATEVGAGARTWLGTIMPSGYILQEGDLVILDIGARYKGYHGDHARSFVVGDKPTDEQRRFLDVIHDSLEYTLDNLKPGMLASEVHDLGAKICREAGYGKYWWQAFIPHGNGISMHEWPKFERGVPDLPVQPNMVLNIEPGLYIPDWGGARIEQQIIITEDGHELLSKYPTRLW